MGSPDRSRSAPAGVGRTGRAESAVTQEKILDAAEALFIEMGFAATSLRAVASRAGVNLAAAHYHFGSKEGLLAATVHRRIAPANAMRLKALDELEARSTPASVDEIVALFFEPLRDERVRKTVPPLIARISGEPDSVSKPLIEGVFGETGRRFVGALAAALPDVEVDELRWRFHFVVGAMIQLLNFEFPVAMAADAHGPNDGLSRLQKFAVAGITQRAQTERTNREGRG